MCLTFKQRRNYAGEIRIKRWINVEEWGGGGRQCVLMK